MQTKSRHVLTFKKELVILKVAIISMSARYAVLVAMAQRNVQKSYASTKNEKYLGVADIIINRCEVLTVVFSV